MITLEMEIVSPDEVEIAGQKVTIAGVPTKNYYTCKVLDKDGKVDEEATKEALARVFVSNNPDFPSLYERCGLDGSKEDPENPNVKQFIGLCVYTQMTCEVDEQRQTPTAEQIAKAKANKVTDMRKIGDIMKHPVTGKPLVKYWPKCQEIFGVAPSGAAANKPY